MDIKSIFVTLAIILFQSLAERYNYQEINTVDVKAGMILSYGTILQFINSRVKGLPQYTTEDIASRISEEEAMEWIDYNTIRAIPYAGSGAPIIMFDLEI